MKSEDEIVKKLDEADVLIRDRLGYNISIGLEEDLTDARNEIQKIITKLIARGKK